MKEITFEDIQRANEQIKTTDIKGKDYAEVNQRIKACRMVYPTGRIHTQLISNENGVCIFRAEIYGNEIREIDGMLHQATALLATGTAYEKENSTFINKTSYIENCETSAVGRALGMCGFGIDTSVGSAEEVQNAIANQEEATIQTEEEAKQYVITFGKYKDKTLGEVVENDINYCDWLLYNAQDPNVKKGITLLTGVVPKTENEQEEILNLTIELNDLVRDKNYGYEKIHKHYKVKSTNEMSIEQLKDAIEKLKGMK
jgi:hypothetical protein